MTGSLDQCSLSGGEFDSMADENGYLVIQKRLLKSKDLSKKKIQTRNMIHGLSQCSGGYFCFPSAVLESSVDYQITRAFGLSQNQQPGSHKVTGINTNRTSLSVTGPQDRLFYTCLSRKCTPGPPPWKPLTTLISCLPAC